MRSEAVERNDRQPPGPTPFVVRVLEGDITQARASLIVVNHFNGVPIGGAARALDSALGGAISRRVSLGGLDGPLGTTHFLPTTTATLAAGAALVVSMGDPERFDIERLPDVGASMVEAVAAVGLRDAATIVHAAGSGIDAARATRLLLEGVVNAVAVVPGGHCLRELSFVERATARLPDVVRGVRAAKCPPSVHVYVEQGKLPTSPHPAQQPAEVVPDHVRIGVTRTGADLKVTVIGLGSFDTADAVPYPPTLGTTLLRDLQHQVMAEQDVHARARYLEGIGSQLNNAFLCWEGSPAVKSLEESSSHPVVLRLDRSTARLPWELLHTDGGFLARSRQVARQLEIQGPGRVTVRPERRGDALKVLVIGDPAGDLPGARSEAEAVVERLRALPQVEVTPLLGPVDHDRVSAALNGDDHDVVHYAGHGNFDSLTNAGGLKLAGGQLLTAADLSTRRYVPRLFFANACHAASMGEDVFSGAEPTLDLVRGLLRAGVRHLIGSQWAVDDAAARTFALAFYDAVAAGSGQTVGEAVRRGREAVVAAHGAGEPAWAAYALYGNPWDWVR